MKLKQSVYGSQNERELFKTLHSHWSDKFDIFLSLPLANILSFEEGELTEGEKEFFFKTSVDYTLCAKNGRPLLSIEFDGYGHGFSRNAEYVQVVPIPSQPYRKLKMDAKLRWCSSVLYPLYVISYEEKNPVTDDCDLTIIDGIIGKYISSVNVHRMVDEYDWSKELDGLPEHLSRERIQDTLTDMEVVSELDNNPLFRKSAELEEEIHRHKLMTSYSCFPIHEPELPDDMDIKARIQNFDKLVMRLGCRIEAKTPNGQMTETVLIRNMDLYAGILAEEIAKIKLYSKILKQYGPKS